MRVIPAIDLLGGQAVRLSEGDPARATVYAVLQLFVRRGLLREWGSAGASGAAPRHV